MVKYENNWIFSPHGRCGFLTALVKTVRLIQNFTIVLRIIHFEYRYQ